MQINDQLYECLITCQSQKRASEIEVKLLVFLTFFINAFMKTLIKSTIYCQTVPFTHVCCENYISEFSIFVLSLSKSGNILSRSMANENCLFSSASLIVTGRR